MALGTTSDLRSVRSLWGVPYQGRTELRLAGLDVGYRSELVLREHHQEGECFLHFLECGVAEPRWVIDAPYYVHGEAQPIPLVRPMKQFDQHDGE